MLVDEFLERTAAEYPAHVGLVCGNRRLTYRQLDEAANRLANGLREAGVGRGDRVIVHLDNTVEAVLSIFGVLKAGGIFALVNPTIKAEKLAYVLNDSEAALLITDRRYEPVAAEALARAPHVGAVAVVADTPQLDRPLGTARRISFSDLLNAPARKPARETIDQDLAALVYTSGSTGHPKGVMLTHLNMVAAATSINEYLANTADDVILNVLPLSFDYGLYQVLLAFGAGARLVLERSFAYPSATLERIACERVTGFPIVPMIGALILKHDLDSYDYSSLRYITNTGAALPPTHVEALRTRLPHVRIFSMYGLTECKRVSFLSPEELDRRPTSVGKPMNNVEVYLVDQGRRIETGIGELVVRGSNVMKGYWRAPEATARVLKPGLLPGEMVLHTGDVFRIDDEGFMYFISRSDDVIKTRGQKVSPREVENVLHAAPGVQEAVVIGVPDPVLGQAVEAFVTLDGRTRVTVQDLLRHCARHLEDFMVPQKVTIVDELPRTSSGKVARAPLKTGTLN